METALWEYNETWRLQTDVPKIINKLKRRKEVDLIGTSPNSNWHIFHIQYSSRKNALKGLTRLNTIFSSPKTPFVVVHLIRLP